MAARAYRALLRQINETFQGDMPNIRKMKAQAHEMFMANKSVTDPSAIEHHLLEAREATQFIRENIVQAHKTSCGTFAVRPEAAQQLQDMNRSHGQESGGGSPLG